MRSRQYLRVLVLAALLGVPISAAAYWFLWAINHGRRLLFEMLPTALGFTSAPAWWPLPFLALGGLLMGAAIRYMPGRGGHSPVDGFQTGAPPTAVELPGVLLAAFASLCFGAVVGPEGPLIALGSGLAALLLRVRKHQRRQRARPRPQHGQPQRRQDRQGEAIHSVPTVHHQVPGLEIVLYQPGALATERSGPSLALQAGPK
jgi:H+/Cl- antiporter ClcA